MKQDITKELEQILEAVFIHGSKTPDKSRDLPKGQLTIAEAITQLQSYIEKIIVNTRQEYLKEIFGTRTAFMAMNRHLSPAKQVEGGNYET